MYSKQNRIRFPIWEYLNQPLFRDDRLPVFNPRRFAYIYRVDLLERCLHKECDAK